MIKTKQTEQMRCAVPTDSVGWQTLTILPPRRLWVIGATVNKRVLPMNLQDDGIWQLSNGTDCKEAVTHWMMFPLHPLLQNIKVSQ